MSLPQAMSGITEPSSANESSRQSFSEKSHGSESESQRSSRSSRSSSRSQSRSQSRQQSPRDNRPTRIRITEKLMVTLLPPGKELCKDYMGMGLPPPGEDLRPVGYPEPFMPLNGGDVMLLRRWVT